MLADTHVRNKDGLHLVVALRCSGLGELSGV
jgi:hypothetical protein